MKYFLFFASILVSLNGFAQTYSVSGRIVDASTNEPLPMASIQIENSQSGTVTDLSGYFEIRNIKEDKVKLLFSFIGYKPGFINCDFTKNTYKDIRISLSPDALALDEIVVVGVAQGQVKALIDQQNAENIKNIVSYEQIEQFPDLNAAEAMQRIPGVTLQREQGEGKFIQLRGTPPELTTFNVNGEQIPSPEGDVRYVGMDIISADQVEFIEISKVLTPDLDADGIGGSVNIITKKAQSEIPELRLTASGGYNNLRGTSNSNLQFSFGQRKGKIGFHLNASHYVNNTGSDNLEFKYIKGPFWGDDTSGKDNYHLMYKELQLRHYDIKKKRTGLSATIDYSLNNRTSFYIRGMYNRYEDDQVRRRKIYTLEDAVTMDYYLYGGVEHDVKSRTKKQNVNTLNVGGLHKGSRIEIDFEASLAMATEDVPNRLESGFENPGQAITIQIDRSDPDWPKAIIPDSAHYANATNYDAYEFDNLLLKESIVRDINTSAKVNFKLPYNFSPLSSGFIKFGGKIRIKNKDRDVTAKSFKDFRHDWNQYTPSDHADPLYLTTVTDDFKDDNLLGQGYVVDNMPSNVLMRDFFNFYPNLFIYGSKGGTQTKVESIATDYSAIENIYAAYGMIHHDFNRLMILAGVRFERTDVNYDGYDVVLNRNNYLDTIVSKNDKRTHQFILPQFQAKYSFPNDFNLRAAVTYTFSRPNFEDVLPYREQERDAVKYGNPDLKFPRSLNIDLLAEKYLSQNGIISGGVYFKKIDHFVTYYTIFAHEDTITNSLVEITTAMNGNNAFVVGSEIQGQFKLDFLPGFLSNFGIFSNYTYTYSEAYIQKRLPANYSDLVVKIDDSGFEFLASDDEEEKISMPGQAKHSGNIALYYETDKFYVKLSANYHDAFLSQLGGDKDLDEYYDEAWHLDFNAIWNVSGNFKLFADVVNLTNSPLRYYLGTPEYVKQREYYSWWCRLGIKLTL
jgi:TonB-dependent receptor